MSYKILLLFHVDAKVMIHSENHKFQLHIYYFYENKHQNLNRYCYKNAEVKKIRRERGESSKLFYLPSFH